MPKGLSSEYLRERERERDRERERERERERVREMSSGIGLVSRPCASFDPFGRGHFSQ